MQITDEGIVGEEGEIYIRSANGGTTYLPANEAIEHFLSEEGYRMTIEVGDYTLVIRKDTSQDTENMLYDERVNQKSVEALITVRQTV